MKPDDYQNKNRQPGQPNQANINQKDKGKGQQQPMSNKGGQGSQGGGLGNQNKNQWQNPQGGRQDSSDK